jgi:hypothetical protein
LQKAGWSVMEMPAFLVQAGGVPAAPTFSYVPLGPWNAQVDIVYMLHNPLQQAGLNARGELSPTFQQMEQAWRILGVNPQEERVAVTELNPMIAPSQYIDSCAPEYDKVCASMMDAALALKPRVLVVFGYYNRERWINNVEDLEEVCDTVMDPGCRGMAVRVHGGFVVEVYFAPHPSWFTAYERCIEVLASAHGKPVPANLGGLRLDRGYSVIKDVEAAPPGRFVGLEVDSVSRRFVLADGVVTHNCRGIYTQAPYTEYISTRWYR